MKASIALPCSTIKRVWQEEGKVSPSSPPRPFSFVTGLLFKKRPKVVSRPRWWPPPLEQLLFLSPYVVWCCVPSYISRTERMHIISPPFFWLLVSIPNTGLYISICPRVWDRHTVSYRSHDPTFLSALSFRLNLSTFPIPSIHPSRRRRGFSSLYFSALIMMQSPGT